MGRRAGWGRHAMSLDPNSGPRRVVLVGAGHAHLETLRHADEFVSRGHELILIAPGPFWYSGLATGVLGGRYPASLDQIDVGQLVTEAGGRLVRDVATAIDTAAKRIEVAENRPVSYDVLSLDVGSAVPTDAIPGLAEQARAVKPIAELARLRTDLTARLATATPAAPLRLVVVGDGPTACEVAGNALRLGLEGGGGLSVTVLARADRLLPHAAVSISRRVQASLTARGARVALGSGLARVEPGTAILADGERVPFDLIVAATGLVPSSLLRCAGLPLDAEGALRVDPFLRSVADPTVFGGGDAVALEGCTLPRVGVHAVRQGAVLRRNLLATLEGRRLRAYRPRRRVLQILNLGDGTGVATWGPLHWHGRAAMWLKDRIDRQFLAAHRPRSPAPAAR